MMFDLTHIIVAMLALTLTHILVTGLVVAVVLILAAWRRWHQAPPQCERCGLHYCPGGAECIAHALTTQVAQDDRDYWTCPQCGAHFNEAWLSSEPGRDGRDGVDCPACGAFLVAEELTNDLVTWKRACEEIDSNVEGS
jgi:hypothetical protein